MSRACTHFGSRSSPLASPGRAEKKKEKTGSSDFARFPPSFLLPPPLSLSLSLSIRHLVTRNKREIMAHELRVEGDKVIESDSTGHVVATKASFLLSFFLLVSLPQQQSSEPPAGENKRGIVDESLSSES